MGGEIPSDFVAFLAARNGCGVDTSVFPVGPDNSFGISVFLEADRIGREKALFGDRLSPQTWPIADAEGGNYLCQSRGETGEWSVGFWDHELEEETFLSHSFAEFLELMEKFDPSSVELKPGQLISVRIDPSLLTDDSLP